MENGPRSGPKGDRRRVKRSRGLYGWRCSSVCLPCGSDRTLPRAIGSSAWFSPRVATARHRPFSFSRRANASRAMARRSASPSVVCSSSAKRRSTARSFVRQRNPEVRNVLFGILVASHRCSLDQNAGTKAMRNATGRPSPRTPATAPARPGRCATLAHLDVHRVRRCRRGSVAHPRRRRRNGRAGQSPVGWMSGSSETVAVSVTSL